jgi:hypothetical protein
VAPRQGRVGRAACSARDPVLHVQRPMLLRLLAQAALQSQHVYFGNEGDSVATPRCESKQDSGRSFIVWQHAMKDHWLIEDMAAPKMANRDDQRHAVVAVAKRKLARIRPSAAVASFGMCPEPEPIKADDLIQWARHDDRDLSSRKEGWPAALPATHVQMRGDVPLLIVILDRRRCKHYKTIRFAQNLAKMLSKSYAPTEVEDWAAGAAGPGN